MEALDDNALVEMAELISAAKAYKAKQQAKGLGTIGEEIELAFFSGVNYAIDKICELLDKNKKSTQ